MSEEVPGQVDDAIDEETEEAAPRRGGRKGPRFRKADARPLLYVAREIDAFADGLPDCVALDFETTGFFYDKGDKRTKGAGARIIEVGAVRYDPRGHEVASVETLIRLPDGVTISDEVQELTHITPEMVASDGREIVPVLDELAALMRDAVVIGHNINFDVAHWHDNEEGLGRVVPFAHQYLACADGCPTRDHPARCQKSCSTPECASASAGLGPLVGFDTLTAARRVFPDAEVQKLAAVSASLGVELAEAHRAPADARATYAVARLLVEHFRRYPVPKGLVRKTDVPDRVRDALRPALLAWREGRAAEDGVPLWRILTHEAVESILRYPPTDLDQVARVIGITKTQAGREGETIARLVGEASARRDG